MNRPTFGLIVCAIIAVISIPAPGQDQDKPRRGFLSVLKAAQSVTVKENGGRYEVTVMDEVRLGHRITEVGADYLVVEDVAGVTETRIPIYSIKAIVRLKSPRK